MLLYASMTIACLGLLPQGGGAPQDKAILAPADQKALQSKLTRLLEARTAYDEGGNEKAREKAQKEYDKAKEAFFSDWTTKCEKKGDLLKSVPDLQAIFGNTLSYERKSAMSLRKVDPKEGMPSYYLSVPKVYKAETPTRTLLLLPGLDEKSEWTDGKRWFDLTWTDKAPLVGDTIIHIPAPAKDIEFDPVPDYSRTEAESEEFRRNGELLKSFGDTQRTYNLDRNHRYLDVGKGAGAYALRVATHFPDLFAGIIVRHPTEVDEIRLGSMLGQHVLLLSSAATADVCKAIKARLDELDASICTVLQTTDEYPFKAAAPEVEAWMASVQRVINRPKIVIEPNDARWRKSSWVAIETMDAIHTAPADMKPRVTVEADRAQNRITIKAVGVESIALQLNDALVDLDKEFTVVVNDKATKETRRRDFNRMFESMLLRFDTDFLFPVQFVVRVPKDEAKPAEAGGNK